MKGFFKISSFIGFLICISFSVYSQNKNDLEQQKKENIEKIQYTRQLLDQTKEEKKASLSQLNLIVKGIDYRLSLIQNLEEQNDDLSTEIKNIAVEIGENKNHIEKLKREYADIIRKSYQNIDKPLPLMYILSAEDLNQGYQRLKYLKYLNEYRRETVEKIFTLNDSLLARQDLLEKKKIEKSKTIAQISTEQDKLSKDRSAKNRIINELKNKEKQLLAEIEKREQVQKRIEDEIKRIIEEEARKAKETNSFARMTPDERLISEDFGKNKGRLPWPTLQGIVIGKFGEQNHPVLKGYKIRSNGIDIRTTENSDVRAVFRGTVTKVIAILGTNYTIIIKHGNFWTVYQNIVDVNVKAGDRVEVKQSIGKVFTDADNITKLHFEIWLDRNVLDPALWLSQ